MRIIAEIPHQFCKISIFYMNGKYIIQFAAGLYEQSFKVSELDYAITNVEDIKTIVNEEFINMVLIRFKEMNGQFTKALKDF